MEIYNVIMGLMNTLLVIIVTGMGFFLKTLYAECRQNAKDLSSFMITVASSHPTHAEFNRRFDRVDANMERIDKKLDDKLENIVNKMDTIVQERRKDDTH